MPVIDTSVLLALISSDDEHHRRARKAAGEPGVYVVASVVLQEFLMALGRRITALAGSAQARTAVRQAYRWLASEPAFRIQADYDVDAAGRLYLANPALSYADAVGVAVARASRDELLTFDQAQRAAFESS